jgi:multidrug efflux pump subunit AcrA (membrane-fusion protein)
MTDKVTEMTPATPEHPPVFGAVFTGFLMILLFVGGFVAWAGVAPLQSAAIAPGSVNLDTYRKTVQHFEGGIISEILIREGQEVAKDEILILLDETRAKASIELLQAQIAAEKKQLTFIDEEIFAIEILLKKGLAKKPRILALYRRKAELDGKRIEHLAQLRAAEDVIARSSIRAPISGAVVGLQVHTSGGVVKAGEPLLSIVPKDEPLVIEARIDPNDIDIVHKGLPAQVRLTPFNARMVPPIPASVVWVSADSMSDQKTGTSYYLARVKLTELPSELPQGVQLYPGMPAEVMILTGERTFLSYLAAPITRSFRRAFREQ